MPLVQPDSYPQPENLRLPAPDEPTPPASQHPTVIRIIGATDAEPKYDADTDLTVQQLGDGTVKIHKGKPAPARDPNKASRHDDNLAEELADDELARIAEMVLTGVQADLDSRKEWIQGYDLGIDLLGTKVEIPGATSSVVTGAPLQGMSTVRHPLLLEGTIRGQSNAMAELLPAAGPVKVRDDAPQEPEAAAIPNAGDTDVPIPGAAPAAAAPQSQDRNALAEAFEKDLNHYLTTTATEYYPDTDRMLFYVYFGGCAFKKVYWCPIRSRPVSESIYAPDLIVSHDITDLANALRVTHRITMRRSQVIRLQLKEVYRGVDLGTPVEDQNDTTTKEKIGQSQGINTRPQLTEDHKHIIYETYLELDLPGSLGHKKKNGQPSHLPLPYVVTVDKTSRQVLAIRRNWAEGDADYLACQTFVKYGMVPGLGFYDYGLVHIVGNQTMALTAIERELIDAGQFANFPGFLLAKFGMKQRTNVLRVPPGSGIYIETGGKPIGDVAKELPYKGPSEALAAFFEKIEQNARQLAGTADIQVGEGTANAPVGTVMALIDASTKIMSAIHKRLHKAQAEEFRLLQKLFAANPEALWKGRKNPARKWKDPAEVQDLELVPAADPNVPGNMHRYGQGAALVQIFTSMPGVLVPQEVADRVLRMLGIQDYKALIAQPPPPGSQPPDPKIVAANIKAQSEQASEQAQNQRLQVESADRAAERASREKIASQTTWSNLLKAHAQFGQHQQSTAADIYKTHFGAQQDLAGQVLDHLHEHALEGTRAALAPPPAPGSNGAGP